MNHREGFLARTAIALLALELVTAAGLAVVGSLSHRSRTAASAANRRLVSELGLGDLALWSDASYCRHPVLAVFSTAHSDHPSAMDHFPAGSIVPPPRPDLLDRETGP